MDMAEKKQADEQAVQTEGGEKLMERVEMTGDGEGVVTRGADDDAKDSLSPEQTRQAGVTNAPQHWDADTQTFHAAEGDPFAENVDAANEAQTDPGPRTQNLSPKHGGGRKD